MRVRDVMTAKVVTATIDTTVAQVAGMLAASRISAVPVVDSAGHVLGMVSEGDLFRRVETGTEKRRSWWLDLFTDPSTQAREFSKQEGVRAEHVMTRPVISVGEDSELARVADLMQAHGVKRLPVMTGDKLVGIVSERDYARKVVLLGRSSEETRVEAIMTQKVVTVTAKQDAHDCMRLMTDMRIRHLPVVSGDRVIGVLSIGDLVRAVIEEQERTIADLESYIRS